MNRKYLAMTLLLAVLGLGVFLRFANLNVSVRTKDEAVYTYYGKTVANEGIKGIERLIKEYNRNEKMWVYPTPVKIGYICLSAAVIKIAGSADTQVLSYLSCAASVVSLLILALMGLRFFNWESAVCAVLLSSVSPLDLAMARRAWQDGIFGLFGLLLVYSVCEIARDSKRKLWFVLFMILGVVCILIKETGIIVYGLCVVWLLGVILIRERAVKKSLCLAGFSLVSIMLGVFILAVFSGGVRSIFAAVNHNLASLSVNSYALQYHSGPWYQFLQGFFIVSPLSVFLWIIGVLVVFTRQNNCRGIGLGIIFFMAAFTGILMLSYYSKNLRYLSVIFVLFYLISGAGGGYIFLFLKTKLSRRVFRVAAAVFILILSISALLDYFNFRYVFIEKEIPDLGVKCLVDYSIYRFD